MNTFYQIWGVTTPEEAIAKLESQRSESIEKLRQKGITQPRNLEEQALYLIGQDIYEKLIKGYTEKQWGRKCTDLPAFIIKRLPIRLVFDNNYFNDTYQGIPIGGYNKLINGLLKDIETKTNTNFFLTEKSLKILPIQLYIQERLMNIMITALENLNIGQFILKLKY